MRSSSVCDNLRFQCTRSLISLIPLISLILLISLISLICFTESGRLSVHMANSFAKRRKRGPKKHEKRRSNVS